MRRSVQMKFFIVSMLFCCFITKNISAQSTMDSVKNAVVILFDAMKNGDGKKIQTAFADSAVMQTIDKTEDGNLIVHNESIAEFANVISKLKKGTAEERIQFETVKINGPLASVWTQYSFYLNGQLLHCGVNSFQLVRLNGKWKIQYLIDTRKKQDCK